MEKEVVRTEKGAQPVGPYSQGIKAGGFIFVSSQGPLQPGTGELVLGGIEPQTERTLKNIGAILEAAGSGMDKVVKVTVYLKDPRDFKAMNDVYRRFFKEPYPARTTVTAQMVREGMLIVIDAIAHT